MINKLNHHFPILLLFLITLILSLTNYKPHTFLSGWDTLHPEFNFELNIKRSLMGVFRTEQGLGAVAAHSHMADLPHIFILYILHFMLPIDFLRYAYIFLCLVLGPIGMYLFLKEVVLRKTVPSFLGGLFYVLNPAALQTFNVPFEMFTTLYATLPYIFLFASKYLLDNKNTAKNLAIFSVFILFTTPAAYAATLWYTFFVSFLLYFSTFIFLIKRKYKIIRKFLILICAIFFVNCFWMLPNMYFALNHGEDIVNANINKLFSEEAFLKNKEFGNLKDMLLLKTFYFDWAIYDGKGQFIELLHPFKIYFNKWYILAIGYLLSILCILGMVYSFKIKKVVAFSILALLVFCLFFLINANQPVGSIFNFLQKNVPFFKEAFRFPGDKILNIYVFMVSILFGFSQLFIVSFLNKVNKRLSLFYPLIMVMILFYYMLPGFQGNFINPGMRIEIPKEYFQLFLYMNRQKDTGRVANLPAHSFWGWVYHNWNNKEMPSFQGAGFLYFGIKQSILERDFDRWSPYNEQYFREVSYAMYSKNADLLKEVIEKYDISYLLLDTSIIAPNISSQILFHNEIEDLLTALEKQGVISPPIQFGAHLFLYHVNNTNPYPILTIKKAAFVTPTTTALYSDSLYSIYEDYITDITGDTQNSAFIFPLRNLINNQSKVDKKIAEEGVESIRINLPSGSRYDINDSLFTPKIFPTDLVVEKKEGRLLLSFYPNVAIFDNINPISPIKGEVPFSKNYTSPLISINHKILDLSGLPFNTPLSLEKIFLSDEDNFLSLYNLEVKNMKSLVPDINPLFFYCREDQVDKEGIKAILESDRIKISKDKDSSLCITFPLSFLQNDGKSLEKFVKLSFVYEGESNISACVRENGHASCSYPTKMQGEGSEKTILFTIMQHEIPASNLLVILDPKIQSSEEKLSSLVFEEANPAYEVPLEKELIENAFPKTPSAFSEITLSKKPLVINDVTHDNRFINDCKLKKGISEKQILEEGDKRMIRYVSEEGSFCDHFSFDTLPHSLSYLILVESKNENGLPLNLCITNYTSRRCDLYTKLSRWKNFNSDIFLLPAIDKEGVGFDVNFENVGVKGTPAVNYLKSVTIIPFPYELLEQVFVITGKNTTRTFTGTIEKVEPYTSLLFKITTDGKPMLLNLSYSYEKGWKLYRTMNKESGIMNFLQAAFPFLLGKEIKEHVLVNNWANGWIIDNSQLSTLNSQFIIIYLPQYLEYFGFLILVIFFMMLIYPFMIKKLRFRRTHSSPNLRGVGMPGK